MKKQYTLIQVICAMIGTVIYTISILDMLGVTNVYEQITEFVSRKTKRYLGNEVVTTYIEKYKEGQYIGG